MTHAPAWLTARPIAHRGLHDAQAGIIENTISAANAAIVAGYAIEIDVQISADGEAMVHHDDALGRLNEGAAALAEMTAADLKAIPFKSTTDRIVALGEFCENVDGRVPLIIELKSRFDGDLRIARRAAELVNVYRGPAALMSFDPQLIECLRREYPSVIRGIVAERHYDDAEYDAITPDLKQSMAHLLHSWRTRPQFVAYRIHDLPSPGPWAARHVFGLPVLTWTVRTPQDAARAERHADQMIFEGWRPVLG
jgi:glycerophosphoryl diester phosphodiesterase